MANPNQEDTTTTTSTTEPTTTVDPQINTQESGESQPTTPAEHDAAQDLPNPDPAHAAPSTDLNASGSVASPAVTEPENSQTLNDTEQTGEERLAQARSDALTNHAASRGLDGASQESSSEEVVA